MPIKSTPMQQLLSRVQTWCGIKIVESKAVTLVTLREKTIARFPSPETLEVVLCGSIARQFKENPEELPDGVRVLEDGNRLAVDLTEPGGMEEAVRTLLNAYILAERPESRDWWLDEAHLHEDPTCEKLAEEIERFREQMRQARTEAG
ncbi:MAG: hypothetical protein PWP23_1017 [Candidatus Sumerlaeota bacterium]|nr:hypothetical protein [Candidatus Sumerlaeota bacterium]